MAVNGFTKNALFIGGIYCMSRQAIHMFKEYLHYQIQLNMQRVRELGWLGTQDKIYDIPIHNWPRGLYLIQLKGENKVLGESINEADSQQVKPVSSFNTKYVYVLK